MASDLFGSLGGLMKGLSSMMPQDDPAIKMMTAQTEVSSLKTQEKDLYAEIGKKAVELYGLDSFGALADKLRLVQANLSEAQAVLDSKKAEQESRERAAKEAAQAVTCPSCGHVNNDEQNSARNVVRNSVHQRNFVWNVERNLPPEFVFAVNAEQDSRNKQRKQQK